jgi:hypothetical protein
MTKKWLFPLMVGINLFTASCQCARLETNGINLDFIDASDAQKQQMRLSQTQYASSINKEVDNGTSLTSIEDDAQILFKLNFSRNSNLLDDTAMCEMSQLMDNLEKSSRHLPTVVRTAHKLRVMALSVDSNSLSISKRKKLRTIAAKGQAVISRVGRSLRSQQLRVTHKKISRQTLLTDYFKF